jgi:hypothetical protein
VRRPEPDYKKLARALVLVAKEMQEARELGISFEQLRDRRERNVKQDR